MKYVDVYVPGAHKHIPGDLQPGEFQVYCEECGYKADKNTAVKPACPECGARLFVARESAKRER